MGWPADVVTTISGPAERHTATASATPTPTTNGPPADPSAPIVFTKPTDEPAAELASYYAQKPTWRACKGSKRDKCATISVPIDYSKPAGATVRVAMRKVPALKPADRKGTLFVNPGGPGGSGIDFAKEASTYFSKDVRKVWDVIGFDPRGIGQSGSFECLRPQDLDAMHAADPTPDSAAEKAAADRVARARLEGCVRRGGELADNMSTENVARDLDIMRAVAGDSHLNYLGVSYGTLLGGLYADLFTSRVGLMVLDSAVGGDGFDDDTVGQWDVDRWAGDDAREFDELFAEYVTGCTKREQCPLGKDPDAAETRLLKLLGRLERRPLRTAVDSLPRLTQGWAVTALRGALLYPEAWEDLDYALDLALDDADGTGLAFLAMMDSGRERDGSYSDATFASNGLPVKCADWPVRGFDLLDPSPVIQKNNPLWSLVKGSIRSPCVGWPGKTRTTLLIGAEPATPMLVIGNERDAVTPISSTKYMARVMVRSRLVTVDAGGHGAYGAGNSCADDIVDTYFVKAVAPRNFTECKAD